MSVNELKNIIHVGQMKTGTTYIQNVLNKNRERLLSYGVCYPGKRLNQQHACYGLVPEHIAWKVDGKKHELLAEELLKEVQKTSGRFLISSEALSSMNSAGIEKFLSFWDGKVDEVIFTVRPLNKSLPSAWQQSIKGGNLSNVFDFFARLKGSRAKRDGLWRTYSYGQNIKNWSAFTNVKTIVVGNKVSDDLWRNFATAANLTEDIDSNIKKDGSNVSLNFEGTEFLRYLNQMMKDKAFEKSARQLIAQNYLKKFILPLAHDGRGVKIGVPPSLSALVEQWNEEEIALLNEFSSEVYGEPDSLKMHGDTEFKLPNNKDVIAELAIQLGTYLSQKPDDA